jgi:hypothetical protein
VSFEPFGEFSAMTTRKFCERLATMTPLRRTSSGSRGVASCTRLLTLKVALSVSVPTSKVAVMVTVPLEADDELKYSMPSMPESCSSIGAATVRASVSAEAPG